MSNFINIYTDGSCFNNGKKNASGAIGIYFGENDPRNKGIPIEDSKITNQTMEILACIYALNEFTNREKIYLYTDSKYVINSMTSWIKTWESNGWKNIKNKDVENKELLQVLQAKVKEHLVIFKHINSHTSPPNIDSPDYSHWLGNKMADELAVQANKSYVENKLKETLEQTIKDQLLDISKPKKSKSDKSTKTEKSKSDKSTKTEKSKKSKDKKINLENELNI